MNPLTSARHARLLVTLLAAALGAGPALAEKPDWAGGGKERGNGPPGQMKKSRDDRPQQREARAPRAAPRGGHDDHGERRPRASRDARPPAVVLPPGSYFNDGQRRYAQQWYGQQWRAGHCPPGLAKKNNGCLPPGQAKKWRMGQPLPSGVVYYPVPQPVLVQLGTPPAGYRYVRVAGDILLLAIGTRMVVDAITDLGRAL